MLYLYIKYSKLYIQWYSILKFYHYFDILLYFRHSVFFYILSYFDILYVFRTFVIVSKGWSLFRKVGHPFRFFSKKFMPLCRSIALCRSIVVRHVDP